MSAGSGTRVAWHRRLSVRLTAVLALTMLFFNWVEPYILDFAFDKFGFPNGPNFVINSDGSELEHEFGGTFSPPSLDLREELEALLQGAEQLDSGGWQPRASALAALEQSRDLSERSFAWTDPHLIVLAKSATAPVSVGDRLIGDQVLQVFDFRPHEIGGEVTGWFATFVDPHSGAFPLGGVMHTQDMEDVGVAPTEWFIDGEEVSVLAEDEFEKTTKRLDRIWLALSWAFVVAIAFLMSMLVSRWVTGRLTRLAHAAASSGARAVAATGGSGDSSRVHTLFDEKGHDEIAMLAGVLNESWGRVQSLLAELDERDEYRREWIAQVSHDMRTPLTALFACLERAKSDLEEMPHGGQRETLQETLGVAQLDAERVRTLADDLLEIARLDADDALNLESLLPAEVVERATAGLRPLARSRGVSIETKFAPGLPSLYGDGHRLMRVMENLLRNAIEHARSQIQVDLSATDAELVLVVQDDGPGFPDDDGDVQIDQLTSAARATPGSSGIGLVVVNKIVQRHGGQLKLDNSAAGGARIRIGLPHTETE